MAKRKALKGFPKGTWSKEALQVLGERYLAKDKLGRIVETPEGMFYRVAREIAAVEKKFSAKEKQIKKLTRDFYDFMVKRYFIPNSPTLMNAGREGDLQYSACFVLPVGDSLVEIFESIKRSALIHQSGGGTGFSFSRLRPKGSIVKSSRGVASGPVSFMRIFDSATAEIKQGGMRRGANMGVLRVDHPDILEFINSKAEGGINNFNISVALTDKFIQAVKKNSHYQLHDPSLKGKDKKIKARKIFRKIVKMAWRTGDPGVIFIDRLNQGSANPVPSMGPIEATNPCGEQPLYPNEACNLGSINLSLMLEPGSKRINWEKLKEITRLAVRFLDNVIEVNPFPFEEISQTVELNRRIGLGVMGWADLLFQMEIPYGSRRAYKLAGKVMTFIRNEAIVASQGLAKERGPFPNFKKSIYKKKKPLRNATLTTIAPTGSISIIAGCSSGIEPLFALGFKHKTEGREMYFLNPHFQQAAKKYKWGQEVIEKVKNEGSLSGLKVPKKFKQVFVTAHEINWQSHIDTQAAFQVGVDNAVSKTINLPHKATVKDVQKAYLYAYEKGCMGITVYRDRCRQEQVLYAGEKEDQPKKRLEIEVKPRPAVVTGKTYRIETPIGTAFTTLNVNGNAEPLEVFVNVGKVGSDIAADAEAIGRLISLNLRLGSGYSPESVLEQIITQLEGIGGGESVGFGRNRVRSLADGVAKVLREHQGGAKAAESQVKQPSLLKRGIRRDLCPSCGHASLIFEEGCAKCHYCGYNKC
ncbi:vitamin B12-dependent ribonucleotide reductase [Patescibacteria group bacterium]